MFTAPVIKNKNLSAIYNSGRKNVEILTYPKLSIIILNKSNNLLLFNCLNSLSEKSRYPNYEVIIADTGSSQKELAEIDEFVDITTIIKYKPAASRQIAKLNKSIQARLKPKIKALANNQRPHGAPIKLNAIKLSLTCLFYLPYQVCRTADSRNKRIINHGYQATVV